MSRATSPLSWRAIALGLAVPLLIAGVTAAAKITFNSKLDTSRFVEDSVSHHYELREIRSNLKAVCVATQADCR